MLVEIRRLLDKFFDTKGFTDKQLLQLWEVSALKNSPLTISSPLAERRDSA
jgi:hypothetical protein